MLNDKISPMLAYPSDPFNSARHLFEIKWDGTRCLLFKQGDDIRLQNRRLEIITHRYPELRVLAKQIEAQNAILDGELVVLAGGLTDFGKLQQREHLADPTKILLLSQKIPVTYVAFDIIFLNGDKLMALPLFDRKERLSGILRESPHLIASRYVQEHGQAYFQKAVSQGLEGIMAKTLTGPYLIGRRSRLWLKIKPRQVKECAVIGYTKGAGARRDTFGALLLATPEPPGWKYRGKVGSGFSEADLKELTARLQGLTTATSPLPHPPQIRGVKWFRPELWVRVSFQEETSRGHFRAPVFMGMGNHDQGV
jgi:bifunctional non-homologous end joining protein LigD